MLLVVRTLALQALGDVLQFYRSTVGYAVNFDFELHGILGGWFPREVCGVVGSGLLPKPLLAWGGEGGDPKVPTALWWRHHWGAGRSLSWREGSRLVPVRRRWKGVNGCWPPRLVTGDLG